MTRNQRHAFNQSVETPDMAGVMGHQVDNHNRVDEVVVDEETKVILDERPFHVREVVGDQWRQKLHDFGEKAKAKGQEENNAIGNALNAAWTKADAERHKLQTASAEGSENAKISFERASHDLKRLGTKSGPMTSRVGAAELARMLVHCR
jgi:hypothetical protein